MDERVRGHIVFATITSSKPCHLRTANSCQRHGCLGLIRREAINSHLTDLLAYTMWTSRPFSTLPVLALDDENGDELEKFSISRGSDELWVTIKSGDPNTAEPVLEDAWVRGIYIAAAMESLLSIFMCVLKLCALRIRDKLSCTVSCILIPEIIANTMRALVSLNWGMFRFQALPYPVWRYCTSANIGLSFSSTIAISFALRNYLASVGEFNGRLDKYVGKTLALLGGTVIVTDNICTCI